MISSRGEVHLGGGYGSTAYSEQTYSTLNTCEVLREKMSYNQNAGMVFSV